MTLDERIGLYLAKCPPAVSGSRGHDQAFTVACALVWGFALSEDDALRHFTAYNATCCPPWKARDCRHKVQQAAKVNHSKPRGHLLGDGGEDRPKGMHTVPTPVQPVPVRLVARRRHSRTLRTLHSNISTYTGGNSAPSHIGRCGGGTSEASEQRVSTVDIPLADVTRVSTDAETLEVFDAPLEKPATLHDVETPGILRIGAENPPDTFGAVIVPGCTMARPEEIVCSDATWQALEGSAFKTEPLVHLALSMFGPNAVILSTGEGEPCVS